MSDSRISFRPIVPEDRDFLYEVYASTRAEELSVVDWDQAQLDQFLEQQFNAQHTYYQQHYVDAAFDVILLEARAIGRLYVARWENEIRIIDIALLPEYRGKGIGGGIMRDILAEGAAAGKKVSIHVEKNNPALSLYHRLGFREAGDAGVYYYMEWTPEGGA